jgi:hypothetical protein
MLLSDVTQGGHVTHWHVTQTLLAFAYQGKDIVFRLIIEYIVA